MTMLLGGSILVTAAPSCSATTRRKRLLTFSSYHASPWACFSVRVYTGATGTT